MEDFEKYDIRRLSMREIRNIKLQLKEQAWAEKHPGGLFTLVAYTHRWSKIPPITTILSLTTTPNDYPKPAKYGWLPFRCLRYHLGWTYLDPVSQVRRVVGVRSIHDSMRHSRPPDTNLSSHGTRGKRRSSNNLEAFCKMLRAEEVPEKLISEFLALPAIISLQEK